MDSDTTSKGTGPGSGIRIEGDRGGSYDRDPPDPPLRSGVVRTAIATPVVATTATLESERLLIAVLATPDLSEHPERGE